MGRAKTMEPSAFSTRLFVVTPFGSSSATVFGAQRQGAAAQAPLFCAEQAAPLAFIYMPAGTVSRRAAAGVLTAFL